MDACVVKGCMKGKLILTGLVGIAALAPLASVAHPTKQGKMITVTIIRLKEINNLDEDFPRKDQADFYARVHIGSESTRTETMSKDDFRPNWVIQHRATGNIVPIHIRVMDDDGGMEEKDDHVDINPKIGEKTLVLKYNVRTGRITGDATGRRGQTIHTRGGGKDTDKAQIWFSVR
jgi:hypothetical protein